MNEYTCIFYLLVIYSDFGGTLSIIGLKTGQQIFRKIIGYYEEMNLQNSLFSSSHFVPFELFSESG